MPMAELSLWQQKTNEVNNSNTTATVGAGGGTSLSPVPGGGPTVAAPTAASNPKSRFFFGSTGELASAGIFSVYRDFSHVWGVPLTPTATAATTWRRVAPYASVSVAWFAP